MIIVPYNMGDYAYQHYEVKESDHFRLTHMTIPRDYAQTRRLFSERHSMYFWLGDNIRGRYLFDRGEDMLVFFTSYRDARLFHTRWSAT